MKVRSLFGLLALSSLAAVSSCTSEGNARISINAEGAADSTMLVVSRLALNEITSLDTLYLKGGKAKTAIEVQEGSPQFVYLSMAHAESLPLVVLAGDRISVSMSADGVFTVEGSEESLRMIELEKNMNAFNAEFSRLYRQASAKPTKKNETKIKDAKFKLGSMYVNQKKLSTRYIYENINSITVIPLLYQRTPSGLPIFNQNTDAILMRKVYDSLQPVYSTSPYVTSLADEIEARERNIVMEAHMKQAELIDYPEIVLSDINGIERRLSSLKGQVIMLLFWNSPNAEQRLFTTELKSLYSRLHGKGLEIYQVGVETDKTAWALQVKEQSTPWINVCDASGGIDSPILFYNVQSLPAMFLISRDGTIVAKDIFDLDKLEAEIKKLL